MGVGVLSCEFLKALQYMTGTVNTPSTEHTQRKSDKYKQKTKQNNILSPRSSVTYDNYFWVYTVFLGVLLQASFLIISLRNVPLQRPLYRQRELWPLFLVRWCI